MNSTGSSFQEEFFKKHDYYKIIILLLQQGEPVEIMLTGHCMKPLLCERDMISIRPLRAEELRCGDVAIYHVNGRLKAHRFLGFITLDGQKHLLTKSDRRHRCDPPVPAANFLGIIARVTRGGRTMDYETRTWQTVNLLLGKLSPSISVIERPIVFLLRLPKRAVKKVFFAAMIDRPTTARGHARCWCRWSNQRSIVMSGIKKKQELRICIKVNPSCHLKYCFFNVIC